MQQKPFYPAFPDATIMQLRAVLAQAERFPDLLERPECPWSDDAKSVFRRLIARPAVVSTVEVDLDEGKPEAIEAQILTLMRDLKAMQGELGSKDHSERLQVFKLSATLVEKLISLRERTINLKEMSEFQQIIIQYLDEICTKDQTTELMERLRTLSSIGDLNQ